MATILIVEDDGIIAAHLDSLLTAQGYAVLPPVSSGVEAVAAATAQRPDLILMDIQLAGDMDGIEAAAQIQARQDVPIVYLTAFMQDAHLQQAKTTQPYAYLAKPVSSRELIATLETALYRYTLDRRLKESEAKYRTLVESIPGVAYSAQAEPPHRLLHVSERAFDLTGYPLDDFIAGRVHPHKIMWPDDMPTIERAVAGALAGRSPYDVVYRIRRADGEVRWVHDSGQFTFDPDGCPTRLDGVLLDITAQKQIEEQRDVALAALRQREADLKAIIENLPGRAWLKDTCGSYLEANQVFAGSFGMETPADVVGRIDCEVLPPDLVESYRAQDAQVIQSGQPATFSHQVVAADGVRWFETRKTPIRDASGAIVGTAGYAHDVTALRLAAEERLEMERRLLQAQQMESLTVLAGAIAHDFNNILQSVLGNLDLALLDPAMPPDAAQLLATAGRSARQAVDLVRQLLAYAGRDHFQWGDIDLSRLVTDNLPAIRLAVREPVTLDMRLAPNLPPIQADPDHLRRALMNLVTNAIESIGDAAGRVTLKTGVRACDDAYLRQSRLSDKPPAGRYVYFEVSDTGCGMDAAALQRLFDPCYSTKSSGRGLGMPAVQGIVRSHHGVILVRSRVRHGTTVRLLFPLEQPAEPGPPSVDAATPVPAAVPGGPRLVVVVDDNDCRAGQRTGIGRAEEAVRPGATRDTPPEQRFPIVGIGASAGGPLSRRAQAYSPPASPPIFLPNG